jgi:hypothetical protein
VAGYCSTSTQEQRQPRKTRSTQETLTARDAKDAKEKAVAENLVRKGLNGEHRNGMTTEKLPHCRASCLALPWRPWRPLRLLFSSLPISAEEPALKRFHCAVIFKGRKAHPI